MKTLKQNTVPKEVDYFCVPEADNTAVCAKVNARCWVSSWVGTFLQAQFNARSVI